MFSPFRNIIRDKHEVKKVLIALAAATLLFLGIWPVAVPETFLKGLIENAGGGNNDFSIKVEGLRKGLFFSFRADSLKIRKSGKDILEIEDLSAEMNPLALICLKLPVRFTGTISEGNVHGQAVIFRNGNILTVRLENAEIEGLPFLAQAGIGGSGRLSGEMDIKNGSGKITFSLQEARLKSAAFSGLTIPLDLFTEAKGMMTTGVNSLKVVSFTMEGEGIYARLSGDVKGSGIDMKMELMPQSSFVEKNPMLLLLGNYKVSPGYYSVPIQTKTLF